MTKHSRAPQKDSDAKMDRPTSPSSDYCNAYYMAKHLERANANSLVCMVAKNAAERGREKLNPIINDPPLGSGL